MEARSLARLRVHANFAAHQFDQPFGDSQTETGSALVLYAGRLFKFSENFVLHVARNARAGITDLEPENRTGVSPVFRRPGRIL